MDAKQFSPCLYCDKNRPLDPEACFKKKQKAERVLRLAANMSFFDKSGNAWATHSYT